MSTNHWFQLATLGLYSYDIAEEDNMITLNDTQINKEYTIVKINAEDNIKYRLYDLGIYRGAKIKRLRSSPLGDPVSYLVKDTVFAIRNEDAKKIEVKPNE